MPIESLSVLVVEDESYQQMVMLQILKLIGVAEARAASDGASALESILVDGYRPDVMICDLEMPGMDGIQLMRHLVETPFDGAIMLVSAHTAGIMESVSRMATTHGLPVIGALEKPVTHDQLATLLAKAGTARTNPNRPTEHEFTRDQIEGAIDRGEFVPFFQAKLHLDGLAVHGAEALARWLHPNLGLLGPGAFIELVERYDLMRLFTLKLFEVTLAHLENWSTLNFEPHVSINVETTTLADVTFADAVLEATDGSRTAFRSHISFEVTERHGVQELAHYLENLNRLRMRGFGLALDDYGTGFSSMEQLAHIPFTELKLDRSFVDGVADDTRKHSMVEHSVVMAQELGLRTVAEGLEREQDADILKALGCDLAQGFLYSKPIGAEDFLQTYGPQ
ncbi:MAG: EAL domain-containing response regulator [Rhodospirillaceae bacterium]|nr:EAL domain-containing response regulator [Rhodospirillaceae bacterium]